jgi:hypothetical protein
MKRIKPKEKKKGKKTELKEEVDDMTLIEFWREWQSSVHR